MTATVSELKQEAEYFQGIGTALDCDDSTLMVSTDQGVFSAKRALSCLVEPEEGDRVLLAGTIDSDLFVIAVLERMGDKAIAIPLDGDCSINVSRGKLNVAAEKGLNLVTSKEMRLDATDLSLRVHQSRVFIDKLSYFGSRISAYSEKIRLVGVLLDSVVERVAQRFKRSYRVVDEIDHVRSNEIDYRADKNLSLRGQNALIDADELVRLEGEQIHLG
ncbi:hypothetical protein DSCW_07220 [Desulfosarcina widdelii]|uniref:DUF3540 domain-containing protein n=1 Tax=Desulfosarcina widdelii TaxID=947919 RepID=A0A5K7YY17_9BACT|nr:DUF3540 domain-containing protein [Desulfosarcina widdelii]BBO73305.1 hypothetical protein DSCW_07220 [Desulfosarcina widdelii]